MRRCLKYVLGCYRIEHVIIEQRSQANLRVIENAIGFDNFLPSREGA